MRPKRLLFTGGSGLLALNWALLLKDVYEVILCLHSRKINTNFAKTVTLPLDSLEVLVDRFQKMNPDIVINAAAITSVEYCEQNHAEAYLVNVRYAANVAQTCQILNIPLIHMSTDHLFLGSSPYTDESCQVDPINVYALTKAHSEDQVLAYCPSALVIRTNFFGWGTSYRSSMPDQIINALKVGHSYSGFSDVFFTPILASDLALAVLELIEKKAYGIFNLVSDERISKYEFAKLVAKTFNYPSSLIQSISIEDNSKLVKRPKDMSLSNLKAQKLLCRGLGTAAEGLRTLQLQQLNGFQKELQSL